MHVAKHLTMTVLPLTTKNYVVQNVNYVKIKKPWFRVYQAHYTHFLV